MNLNLLLAGVAEEGRHPPLHQSPHFNQSPGFNPNAGFSHNPGFSQQQQQGVYLGQGSPFHQLPPAPPNTSFRSSPLTPYREQLGPAQSAARCNLFPNQQQQLPSLATSSSSSLLGVSHRPNHSAPPSSLGLQDILQRLDSLSKDLPTSSRDTLPATSLLSREPLPSLAQPSLAQPLLPPVSSRDSTPLSWNPLCSLSPTPLSLTPSPTLASTQPIPSANPPPAQALPPNPAPVVRPLMEQKVEAPEEEMRRMKLKMEMKSEDVVRREVDEEAGRRRREEVRRVNPDIGRSPRPRQIESNGSSTAVRGIAKLGPKQVQHQGRETPSASWSQIVRTSSTGRLPTANLPSPTAPVGAPSSSPPSPTAAPAQLPDYHRGPKVDPRWPVQQQVFLGPIPMAISWDEIRNVFYTKVSRKELIHFYVQSKPVNEVVYGQVVFDKVSLANKILKEGQIKVRFNTKTKPSICQLLHLTTCIDFSPLQVRGQEITLTPMAEKMKQMKLEKKK